MSSFQSFEILPLQYLDALAELLDAEGLPHSDLNEPGREFWQLLHGSQVVGYIGVEGSTSDRLLRSFVLKPDSRNGGLGAKALALLEAELKHRGVRSLHLLTTTATQFFQRQGFSSIHRNLAPDAIQRSLEFRSLCPSSASYMVKQLA